MRSQWWRLPRSRSLVLQRLAPTTMGISVATDMWVDIMGISAAIMSFITVDSVTTEACKFCVRRCHRIRRVTTVTVVAIIAVLARTEFRYSEAIEWFNLRCDIIAGTQGTTYSIINNRTYFDACRDD